MSHSDKDPTEQGEEEEFSNVLPLIRGKRKPSLTAPKEGTIHVQEFLDRVAQRNAEHRKKKEKERAEANKGVLRSFRIKP